MCTPVCYMHCSWVARAEHRVSRFWAFFITRTAVILPDMFFTRSTSGTPVSVQTLGVAIQSRKVTRVRDLHPRYVLRRNYRQALWSQNYDTEMRHRNTTLVKGVDNAMSCHRTGYDRQNIRTPTCDSLWPQSFEFSGISLGWISSDTIINHWVTKSYLLALGTTQISDTALLWVCWVSMAEQKKHTGCWAVNVYWLMSQLDDGTITCS